MMIEQEAQRIAEKEWGPLAFVYQRSAGAGLQQRTIARQLLTQLHQNKPTRPGAAASNIENAQYRVKLTRWQRSRSDLVVRTLSYRYIVGVITPDGKHFITKGEGDNWTEAFEDARTRTQTV